MNKDPVIKCKCGNTKEFAVVEMQSTHGVFVRENDGAIVFKRNKNDKDSNLEFDSLKCCFCYNDVSIQVTDFDWGE